MIEEEYELENTSDFETFPWVDSGDFADDDNPEYASEDNRYQRELITSDSARALVERINQTTISKQLKIAFLSNIKTYFTKDAYLAFIRRPDTVLMNLQYDMELAMLSSTTHDRRKNDVTQIKSLVLNNYPFIVSRAIGGLERDMQGKKRIEQRMGTARAYDAELQPKRKGLLKR